MELKKEIKKKLNAIIKTQEMQIADIKEQTKSLQDAMPEHGYRIKAALTKAQNVEEIKTMTLKYTIDEDQYFDTVADAIYDWFFFNTEYRKKTIDVYACEDKIIFYKIVIKLKYKNNHLADAQTINISRGGRRLE